ncbi:MAG TPA: efflux RND transporter periplasmic adaptor subunit [Phycisphaerae bacterium]|nr:efflux RND transporter periplasmic adaptor subunit [Phycisphaerae bacterium]HPS52006.1 efflux RND transporter periplasmic adaptor subunit [Phycisphaerae bacterium]
MKHIVRKSIFAIVILAIIAGIVGWIMQGEAEEKMTFDTVDVTRDDISISIAASGTLEPEEVVDVGAQISGRVLSFGKDKNGKTIDYGSIVEKDSVIAKIDDVLYLADEAEAQANVSSAKAGVQLEKANLGQLQAKFLQAKRDWERAQRLGPSDALAKASYDAYQATYDAAKANVDVGKATILQAEATLTLKEKSLWRAQRNLEYCTIKSPITGMIIDRRVSIGQTVTASMNTPSLFLIARDLRRMQVWVLVNEADITKIYKDQPVTFTVDALPDETFEGKVWKIRPNAAMTQNIVTFTVEIVTDNFKGKLKPYLTANVRFIVSKRENVLTVPLAALSWNPKKEQIAQEYRDYKVAESQPAAEAKTTATQPSSQPADKTIKTTQDILWVKDGEYVKPVEVSVGLTNEAYAEVSGKDLQEHMQVVIGMKPVEEKSDDYVNPFLPFSSKRKR